MLPAAAISAGVPLTRVDVANVAVRGLAGGACVRSADSVRPEGAHSADLVRVVREQRWAAVVAAVSHFVAFDLLRAINNCVNIL